MPGQNLTQHEAQARSALLTVSSYDIALDLTTSGTTFGTLTTVRFDSAEEGNDSFIDFLGESVERIELNGVELDPLTSFDGARIALPDLTAANELTVEATGRYMNTGEGLHRFVDPVDGEVYLYTQFEVADARRMFAVFEQPDLKATFRFTVTAPADWQVVSTMPSPRPFPAVSAVLPGEDSPRPIATWQFEPTPVLSCYVTALIAGPYDVVRDALTTGDGRVVPLGLLCRRSLSPYLDADNLFDTTKRGFAFYEKEFGLPYPFAKYDQIFTPEFNAGAMENVGAVTYHEVYVFRAKVTEALVERRALTMLHELAHMWFGNLVTMRWWNDLWLNESFAEWASTTCQAEATRWNHAWTTFGTAEKAWAYNQDQLSSTHPIVAPIRDLEDVEVNFDGITYAKGASVLKQLVAYVGRQSFTAALRTYFATHAWGNTTLADLLVELEAASGRDMATWSRSWLETAGVNTLRARLDIDDDGVITAAAIDQSAAPDQPTLRPHRLAVGLYDVVDDRLIRRERVELDIDGASTTVPQLIGVQTPDLLLVNDDDLTYAKIRLDPRSLATVLAHPRGIADSLPRALVLGAAWDMTRDAEMAAHDFMHLVLATLAGETESNLIKVLLGQLTTATLLYTAPRRRAESAALLADGLRRLVADAEPGSDAQLQFVTALAGWARRDADLDTVAGWFDGSAPLPGLAVDTEMRWTLLTSLAAGGRADADAIADERRRDDTATGRERAARALAARPTSAAKAEAWAAAVDGDTLPNQTIDAVHQGFMRVADLDLIRPYVARYHEALLRVWNGRTHAIAESVVDGFYPVRLADRALLEATQAWLEANIDAPDALRRLVSENRDTVMRALAAQERDLRG